MFEYILSTVARFRHSHTRMMTVLGEHVMSHGRTYSAGLPEGQHRQVNLLPLLAESCLLSFVPETSVFLPFHSPSRLVMLGPSSLLCPNKGVGINDNRIIRSCIL